MISQDVKSLLADMDDIRRRLSTCIVESEIHATQEVNARTRKESWISEAEKCEAELNKILVQLRGMLMSPKHFALQCDTDGTLLTQIDVNGNLLRLEETTQLGREE